MKGKIAPLWISLVVLSLIAATLGGCAQATPTAAPTQAAAQATQAPAVKPTEPKPAATQPPAPTVPPAPKAVVNRAGVKLPADAAPIEQQVLNLGTTESKWMSWDGSVYDSNTGTVYGIHDSCVRPDKEFVPQPNACESWEISKDGLTWTFRLRKDKVWSDGKPITADDWVFSLQHYARPDFDFEWFYSMANIVNWGDVVSGKKPPEELGVKKVDDYTFSVMTSKPAPFLIKQFAALWVVPKHIVKDPKADGSWALDPTKAVSAGPYKFDHWTKGKELVWVANDKYTGPFPPMME